MLKTRIVTAVVLLAVLLPVLFYGSFTIFTLIAAIFFVAATWEGARLFGIKRPVIAAVLWTAVFMLLVVKGDLSRTMLLFALCAAIWIVRFLPSLAFGLPSLTGGANYSLNVLYGIALLGCFTAIVALFRHSSMYLLSVMVIVWVADIGAYFAGKAFGRHKLAPSISPGKSWEGAIGGWLAVLIIATFALTLPQLQDTFGARIYAKWHGVGFVCVMTVLVAFSIVGDLFESQLKRRAGVKDSSALLPGHGGVLDRCDALIPVLPFAVLFDMWG